MTKTKLSVALAALTVGATIGGIAQFTEIRELRAYIESSGQEAALIRRRLAASESQLKISREALRVLQAQRAEQKPQVAIGEKQSATQPAIVRTKDILRDHPEYASLHKRGIRRATIHQYLSAMQALKLPGDTTAKLKELLVERSLSSLDAAEIAREAGIADSTPEMIKARTDATKALDEAITLLIGKEGREKLEAFSGRTGTWGMLDDYVIDMWDAGVPLADDRIEALALSLRSAMTAQAPSPDYFTTDSKTYTSPAEQEFFAKAGSILSPTQLEVLKTSRRGENQRQAILRDYHRGTQGIVITD